MAKVFLDANETYTVVSNSEVFGGTGTENLIVSGSPTVSVASTIERVELSNPVAAYTFAIAGNTVTVKSGATTVATILVPDTAAGQTVAFADGSAPLKITGLNAATLGGVAVPTTAAAVAATLNTADKSTVGVVAGQTFTLTNSATADTIITTAGNDTINGAVGTVADTDTILDASITDTDSANLTVNAAYTPANITKVEQINLNWDAFGTASLNATNITGAKVITLSSSKVGFLGNSAITAGASQNIVAGPGMTGTMTITGATTAVTATGTASTAMSVTGSGIATVTAGANTTSVTTSGFTTGTINAGTAATISVQDAGTSTNATALTINSNATITNNTTGALSLTAADGNNVTMNAIGASLTVNGAGNVILNTTSGYTGETVTNAKTAGTLTIVSSATGAQDVHKVNADLIQFTGTVNNTLTFKSGANAELTAATTLDTIAGSTAPGEVVNLKASGATIGTLGVDTTLETLKLTAAAPAITGTDLAVSNTVLNSNTLVVSGTNDVSLLLIQNAGTIDASALAGNLTATETGTASILSVTGSATGTNTVTFTGTTVASNYVGGSGNDVITFATTTGSDTAVIGNGANNVAATALTTGDLVVIAGTGVDTVTATALTTGNVSLDLSDGNNVVSLGGTLAAATMAVVTGAGNDSVTLTSPTAATTNITLTLGTGIDTLNISTDDKAGTYVVTGLDVIAVGTDAASAVVSSTLLTGKTYEITGAGTGTDLLQVVMPNVAASVNFSGLVINQTITKGLGGLDITGSGSADTIVASSGNDTIQAGGGNDTITPGPGLDTIDMSGGGNDKIIIHAGDSGLTATTMDNVLTGFNTTADSISFGLAATVTNYAEAAPFDGGATGVVLTLAQVLGVANGLLDTTVRIAVVDNLNLNGTNATVVADLVYVFFDADGDGNADSAIQIVGDVTTVAQGDFVV